MTARARLEGVSRWALRLAVAVALAAIAGLAPAAEPTTGDADRPRYARYDEQDLQRARRTLSSLARLAPALRRPLAGAAGYAVFASGDAGASGVLFVAGQAAGKATLASAPEELLPGRLPSSLVVLLEDRRALARFERSGLSPAARARAVEVVAGRPAGFSYVGGVGVLALGDGGAPTPARAGRRPFAYLPFHRTIVAREGRGCVFGALAPGQADSGASGGASGAATSP